MKAIKAMMMRTHLQLCSSWNSSVAVLGSEDAEPNLDSREKFSYAISLQN
jgi:hypothetical protein